LLIAFAFGFMTDARMAPVTVPLTVGLLVATAFFWVLWRRGRGFIPWFEIGAVYLTVVTLYMAFPLMGFVVLGGNYTPLSDSRLINLVPDPPEIASVAWLYVCHLLGFASVYLAFRGRLRLSRLHPRQPSVAMVLAIASTYLLVIGVEAAIGLLYNTTAGTYAESYLVGQRLPLVFAQLLEHVRGMKYPLSLAIMAVLFTSYRTSRPIIVAWLMVATGLGLARMGSRTEVVLLLLSATAMFHMLVKPLPARLIAAAAAAGLIGFLALGIVRSGNIVSNPFSGTTEFEVLFANALHLARMGRTVHDFPAALYWADLARLVPQQLVPFDKLDPAAWYVTRFFPVYAAAGGGLAFGTITEAAITGGAVSALLRGAALGLCFATVHRSCLRHAGSFWGFVFYVWLLTLCYQSFRNTTFSLDVLIGYRFLPVVVAVTLLTALLATTMRVSARLASRPLPAAAS
jgi:hypothetical protein